MPEEFEPVRGDTDSPAPKETKVRRISNKSARKPTKPTAEKDTEPTKKADEEQAPANQVEGNEDKKQEQKRKNRRRRGKGKSADNASDPSGDNEPKVEETINLIPVDGDETSTLTRLDSPNRPKESQRPKQKPRPKLDPDKVAKNAWKIFLAEVSEEGVALIADNDARELARRCFRLSEIFLEEESRRN